MPIKELCSYCQEDFMNCRCENFHPREDFMRISRKEARDLQDYFEKRAGYLSHEFDEEVHKFLKRLDGFLDY